ncbi:Crossover junction endonuclease mus81 [Ancistrocladus abbreviatus]
MARRGIFQKRETKRDLRLKRKGTMEREREKNTHGHLIKEEEGGRRGQFDELNLSKQSNSQEKASRGEALQGIASGKGFMRKQEFIDEAEASGLSRAPIAPEKGKGKPGQFGSSPRDWYSGWSCMKKLITKGLVVKSSCPAKYMLTEDGRQAAQECMSRSNMIDAVKRSDGSRELSSDPDRQDRVDLEITGADSAREARSSVGISLHFLCSSTSPILAEKKKHVQKEIEQKRSSESLYYWKRILKMKRQAYMAPTLYQNVLRSPPLRFLEKFKDAYKVILVLDDREHFISRGSKSSKIVDSICSQFKIQIEVRRLPVGDGIWIARHKQLHTEYVLDFIVEWKKVDDLRCSVRDNRYRDKKLRLLRSGLKKLTYVVEGDPNSSEAADSIKTAYGFSFF